MSRAIWAENTLTRLAALGTLSRTAGEGGPSPHGSAQSAARGQAPGLVGEGRFMAESSGKGRLLPTERVGSAARIGAGFKDAAAPV